jgi:hypothetical protein
VSAAGVVLRPAGWAGRREAGCQKRCGQPLSSFPWFPGPRLPVRTTGPALAEPLFPAELPARRRQRYTISSRASMKREQVLSEEVAVTLSSTWFGAARRTHSLAPSQPSRSITSCGFGHRPAGVAPRSSGRPPVATEKFEVRGGENRPPDAYPCMSDLDRVANGAPNADLEIRPPTDRIAVTPRARTEAEESGATEQVAAERGESRPTDVSAVWVNAIERRSAAGSTLPGVSTREQAHRLIDQLPESEMAPLVEFIVSRRERDPDLAALLDEEADELLEELDAREGRAGPRASKT